jgi:hypothetical protein
MRQFIAIQFNNLFLIKNNLVIFGLFLVVHWALLPASLVMLQLHMPLVRGLMLCATGGTRFKIHAQPWGRFIYWCVPIQPNFFTSFLMLILFMPTGA